MFKVYGESIEKIIENSFRKGKHINIKDKKLKEIAKINLVKQKIESWLKKNIDEFPFLKKLPSFYQELIPLIYDYKKVERAIDKAKFILRKINDIYYKCLNNAKKSKKIDDVIKYRREFYGRIASFLRDFKPYFEILKEASRSLKELPTIKNMPTVVISGYPNVGKSTLLKKITGANPKIRPYPFTTKGLMLGYIKTLKYDIQVIDTPGLLDRPIEEMNKIEKKALLAILKLSNKIIYIFDLTETCGFPIENQENLFENLRKLVKNDRKFIIYFSKTDILDDKDRLKYYVGKYSKYPVFIDPNELKNYILSYFSTSINF